MRKIQKITERGSREDNSEIIFVFILLIQDYVREHSWKVREMATPITLTLGTTYNNPVTISTHLTSKKNYVEDLEEYANKFAEKDGGFTNADLSNVLGFEVDNRVRKSGQSHEKPA